MISEEQLNKFRQLYRTRFGIDLTREEAMAKANQLLILVKHVYKPISKDIKSLERPP